MYLTHLDFPVNYIMAAVIQIDKGMCVYILVRHAAVILLLPWFCREHKTGIPFVHFVHLYSINICYIVCGSTSLKSLVTLICDSADLEVLVMGSTLV